MSQVLARKYRPRTFDQLIGQDHVAQALTNAITRDRLHHAYLFVGTRGVGKTSIARILARCLNCVNGPTATPCLECSACTSIEAGRFVDLIEVDAASRTKVEDTRELLENVQYAPSEGRFKVYLIDEVHMLSMNSFNALLKTLEEPPPHVKFLLATTEPQKVPVTVLSRCLQFSLRDLPADQVAQHLSQVLTQENIEFETEALEALGRAAKGSIRDAMTLTDQAIAYTDGRVVTSDVQAMLGIQGQDRVPELIEALAEGQAEACLAWIEQTAQANPDWLGMVQSLQRHLHQMALDAALSKPTVLSPEVIQLNYSLATQGYTDLPLAPEPRLGFEMLVLRMLAFRPASGEEYPDPKPSAAVAAATTPTPTPSPEPAPEAEPKPQPSPEPEQAPIIQTPAPSAAPPWEITDGAEPEPPAPIAPAPEVIPEPEPQPAVQAPQVQSAQSLSAEEFTDLLAQSGLAGMAISTLQQGEWGGLQDQTLTLRLPPQSQSIWMDHHHDDTLAAMKSVLSEPVSRLVIDWQEPQGATPNDVLSQRAAARLAEAKVSFREEPTVKWLTQTFDAQIDESSVEPRSE